MMDGSSRRGSTVPVQGAAVSLDAIRHCLEGAIPATVATCSAEGVPNATYVSQMMYVDARHVALSFQFFSKTRQNILSNPQATALVVDPVSAVSYRLELLYLRTETAGALFQSLKAKLAGIASHTGMADVFKLQGADIYRVLSVERLPGMALQRPAPRRNLLAALRGVSARIAECADLACLVDQTLAGLASEFEIRHAMLLMADETRHCVYMVGSRGYASTGVGAEIAYGDGVIGVAAQYRTPIRISHMTQDYRYGCAASGDGADGQDLVQRAIIPFPGLPEPHSQLAVPIVVRCRLVGVLCVESTEDLRFSYDDEDALGTLAVQLGLAIDALQEPAPARPEGEAPPVPALPPRAAPGAPLLELRHYAQNDSIFIGGDYLIKGVPGAILWKLLRVWNESGRVDFSNRELRMSGDLGLPDVVDNLEARLILLQRRLAERCPQLALEKTGRGLFRLRVDQPLQLVDVAES